MMINTKIKYFFISLFLWKVLIYKYNVMLSGVNKHKHPWEELSKQYGRFRSYSNMVMWTENLLWNDTYFKKEMQDKI